LSHNPGAAVMLTTGTTNELHLTLASYARAPYRRNRFLRVIRELALQAELPRELPMIISLTPPDAQFLPIPASTTASHAFFLSSLALPPAVYEFRRLCPPDTLTHRYGRYRPHISFSPASASPANPANPANPTELRLRELRVRYGMRKFTIVLPHSSSSSSSKEPPA
jgi:hypothetical protein